MFIRRQNLLIFLIFSILSFSNFVFADVHTELEAITSSRWTQPISAVPSPFDVTKNDYLDFIDRTYAIISDIINTNAGSDQEKHQYAWAHYAIFYLLQTDNSTWADLAMTCIRGDLAYRTTGSGKDLPVGFNVFASAASTVYNLFSSPYVDAQDKDDMRLWMLKLEEKMTLWEVGAMNRAIGSAVGRELILKLWPTEPGNTARQTYVDQVWNDWWQYGDLSENATGYLSLDIMYIIRWIAIKENPSLYNDTKVINLAYRYLEYASSIGVLPHFGDVTGWNAAAAGWIYIFEKFANVYNDGTFRWAAHCSFDWTVLRETEMWDWGNINYETMSGLMLAYHAADDTLMPQKPNSSSLFTTRKKLRNTSEQEDDDTGYDSYLTETDIPDKLIFRNGWEPSSTMAMIELCPPTMGHGHRDTGSINALVHQGSVLLTAPSYQIKGHSYHNAFIVEPQTTNTGLYAGWHLGATGHMSQSVAPSKVHVSFYAKAVSGSRYLAVFRPFGGGYSYVIELTTDWQQYNLEFDIDYSTSTFFINPLISPKSFNIANSEFLLDDISINRDGYVENLFKNPDFETGINDWTDSSPEIITSWEETDTYNNSDGSLRVKVDVGRYCSEYTLGVQLQDFSKTKSAAYANISMEQYNGKDVDVNRRIFFLGDHGLWVRDSIKAKVAFDAIIGPAWQAVNKYGQQGSNWINTCANVIPVPYINEPLYLMQWPNEPEDLLVWFGNTTGATMTIDDVTYDTTQEVLPQDLLNVHTSRIWQRMDISLNVGQEFHFNSVLMPHKPTDNASTLASQISIVMDTADATVLQIKENQLSRYFLYGINDLGLTQSLANGDIETDAKRFKIVYDRDGIVEFWLVQATYLKQQGTEIFTSPTRTDIYQKGSVNFMKNADFESGISNWLGFRNTTSDATLVSHETTDTYGGSSGAVKLDMTTNGQTLYTWKSGASGSMFRPTGIGKATIGFYAKSLSGSKYLRITRSWGGDTKCIEISTDWKYYQMEFAFSLTSNDLMFCPALSLTSQVATDGSLLLDNVTVEMKNNYTLNPSLDTDISNWNGFVNSTANSSIVSHETTDTNNGTGALKVTVANATQYWYSWKTGALCYLDNPFGAGIKLRVEFYAKSLSGSTNLFISRAYGGDSSRVQLTNQWAKYSVEIYSNWDNSDLIFCTTTTASSKVAGDSVFLLDDVEVTLIPNNLENPSFEEGLVKWSGYWDGTEDNSLLSWDPTDVLYNSKAALHTTIDIEGGPKLNSDISGAVCSVDTIPAFTTARVGFIAKSLSGSKYLNIEEMNGGGRERVQLTTAWAKYEVNITVSNDTSELVFSTVESMTATGNQTVVDGEFLIDDVYVRVLDTH